MMKKEITSILFFLLIAATFTGCRKKEEVSIIPQPVNMEMKRGIFVINRETKIVVDGDVEANLKTAAWVAEQIRKASGMGLAVVSGGPKIKNSICLVQGSVGDNHPEGYELIVDRAGIEIRGEEAGIFYGMQTLLQLLPSEIYSSSLVKNVAWEVPQVHITDAPRFPWRGMHLDVSRHFFPVEFIKKYIDLLAMHKLNVFHWHIVDDQGWRMEVDKYPLLTEKGAWRDGSMEGWDYFVGPPVEGGPVYGGYYTQEDIREIVQYAAERFITVVPEIEMPGHSRAALDAYPELSCSGKPFDPEGATHHYLPPYCAGKEETFRFLEDVLTETMELFPSEYIHIGGDEVPKERWEVCPDCQRRVRDEGLENTRELQSYFITRIEKFVNARGRKIIGWDEILEGGLAPNAAVMSWRGIEGGISAARAAHPVVMSPVAHCYFNHCQVPDPADSKVPCGEYTSLEEIYLYEPIPDTLNSEEAGFIMGAQGNVWTEMIKTPGQVEYMALPRMSALAEVVWSHRESRDYTGFSVRMDAHYLRLDQMGVNYFKE
ncbi:MAG: beta-N-acetylhexosaminidase [Bacteroidota bacterium]